MMRLCLGSPRCRPCNRDSSASDFLEACQKALVGKQGNETGKGRRLMKSVLLSKLPAVGTCGEL